MEEGVQLELLLHSLLTKGRVGDRVSSRLAFAVCWGSGFRAYGLGFRAQRLQYPLNSGIYLKSY